MRPQFTLLITALLVGVGCGGGTVDPETPEPSTTPTYTLTPTPTVTPTPTPTDTPTPEPTATPTPEPVDLDDDGFPASEGDCDDTNPEVSPAATEQCNGIDDDCDGAIDEPCWSAGKWDEAVFAP